MGWDAGFTYGTDGRVETARDHVACSMYHHHNSYGVLYVIIILINMLHVAMFQDV